MPTATATLQGSTLASASKYETVEGNVYFPPDSIDRTKFSPSDTHTTCPWKGVASYYNVTIGADTVKDAAWYYPEPYEKATHIKDHVAFYRNKVKVSVE